MTTAGRIPLEYSEGFKRPARVFKRTMIAEWTEVERVHIDRKKGLDVTWPCGFVNVSCSECDILLCHLSRE